MRPIVAAILLVALAVVTSDRVAAQRADAPPADLGKLVYADFERVENGRPVSARGGLVQLFGYEESGVHKSTFTGLEGASPAAPELVRLEKDDPNHAAKFDYSLRAPNQWAGVTLEIHGRPDADGKAVADDVSGFKVLSLQVYATGIEILRLETISRGAGGKDLGTVYPQMTFKVRKGFNTYRVPLTGFTQPAWAKDVRVDPKDVFKALTSITLTAFCEQCQLNHDGMVVVDNVVFEK